MSLIDGPGLLQPQLIPALQTQLIPMEINLEGFPLFSREKSPKNDVIDIRDKIVAADGQWVEQVWRVTASADFSLPTPFDEDVFVGVMGLVKRRGGIPADGKIRFSTYELVKILRKGKNGENWEKVRQSLDRIAATNYYTQNAFYVLEDERLESYRFRLWTVHFSQAKSKDGRSAEHHTLKLDDIIIRSYNAGYLKLLDTDLWLRLRMPLAKGLYRLVDVRRRGSMSWSVNIRVLRDLLAMSSRYKAPARIWEVLQPGVRALRREGFLLSAMLDGETARFRIHPDFARDWYPAPTEAAPEESPVPPTLDEQASAALVDAGVWPDQARYLVRTFGPEKAFHALDVYNVRGNAADRGAYIAGMIKKGDPVELAEAARLAATKERPAACRAAGAHDQLALVPDGEQPPAPPATRPDPAASSLWSDVLDDLSRVVEMPSWQVWFESVFPISLQDGTLVLEVPNSFAQEYINDRFRQHIVSALEQRLANAHLPVGLRLVVANGPDRGTSR